MWTSRIAQTLAQIALRRTDSSETVVTRAEPRASKSRKNTEGWGERKKSSMSAETSTYPRPPPVFWIQIQNLDSSGVCSALSTGSS